jgi:hypothetical protein
MVVAIGSVHWRKGFWNMRQGYEFNLVLVAVAVSVSATGPGRYSINHALGWDDNLSGAIWSVAVLTLALVGALVVLIGMRSRRDPVAALKDTPDRLPRDSRTGNSSQNHRPRRWSKGVRHRLKALLRFIPVSSRCLTPVRTRARTALPDSETSSWFTNRTRFRKRAGRSARPFSYRGAQI